MNYQKSILKNLIIGNILCAFLVLGVGLWAATTNIAGAVIATGVLVVDTNVKKVQHPTGGIVHEIFVHDGDHVKTGDLLLRLDQTVSKANLSIVDKNYTELASRKIRLEAERDHKPTLVFPPDLQTSEDAQGEAGLFVTRQTAMIGQKAQLEKRVQQLQQQITGDQEQIDSKNAELALIKKELDAVMTLYKKGYSTISRVTAMERDQTRVQGERGQLTSGIAESNQKVAETKLQIIQVDKEFQTEVGKDLRETDAKLGETVEKRVAARDQLSRIDIRAPQDGIIDQSDIHTVGGVVAPGEVLMLVIPEESLVVESKIAPKDISQVKFNEPAFLRFTAFNYKTTPEIVGVVSRISADVTTDPKTGTNYYTIRLSIPIAQQRRLGAIRLVPGMPVEAFIKTGDRKVLSYLVKPLTDQMYRAFREE